MKRIDDNTIAITQDEADRIREFIDNALDYAKDRYTDQYVCLDKWEDGKRRMNPEMYDFATELNTI